jgi:hypothetical protein
LRQAGLDAEIAWKEERRKWESKSRKRVRVKGRPTGTATAMGKRREIPINRRILPLAPPFEPAFDG